MFHPILRTKFRHNRRRFLGLAGALTIGAASGQRVLSALGAESSNQSRPPVGPDVIPAKSTHTIQIGILLGTFSRGGMEEKLEAVRSCGLDCVQFSFDCTGLPAMPDSIPPELIKRIRHEAAARSVRIGALQGTFNMSHPDVEHRRTGLARLRVIAEAGSELGVSLIHLCTGTRDRQSMWTRHPDNDTPAAWRDMAGCVRQACEIAGQTRTVLAFEPEVNNVVDSAAKARRLLDEIGSAQLKVTIDPANIFHRGELPRMREILDEAFTLLGKDIVMAHAKDLDHDGDAGHLAAGEGKLDYDRYLSLLVANGFKGPLLLHGLSETQVPGCVAFLREKLAGSRSPSPRIEG